MASRFVASVTMKRDDVRRQYFSATASTSNSGRSRPAALPVGAWAPLSGAPWGWRMAPAPDAQRHVALPSPDRDYEAGRGLLGE